METLEVIVLRALTRSISIVSKSGVRSTLSHKTVFIKSLCSVLAKFWSDSRVSQWVSWHPFSVSDYPSLGDLSHVIWSFHLESIERVTVRIHKIFLLNLFILITEILILVVFWNNDVFRRGIVWGCIVWNSAVWSSAVGSSAVGSSAVWNRAVWSSAVGSSTVSGCRAVSRCCSVRFRLSLNRTIAPNITRISWEVSTHASLVVVHGTDSVSSLSIAWYTATQITIFHEVKGLPTVVVTIRELIPFRLVFASKRILSFSRKVKVSKQGLESVQTSLTFLVLRAWVSTLKPSVDDIGCESKA